MPSLEQLEHEIKAIKQRNKKVETDKAWETSIIRRVLLLGFTYIALGLYMWAIDIPQPWLNAIVPTVGFLLSTLTLPFFKKLWVRCVLRKKKSSEDS